MIEVLFKNVGQGDSIILEWIRDGVVCYGIIDCNLHINDTNPILDEIKRKVDIKKIDFIILSHLHHDHYSGMGELIEHCISNGIFIDQFLHTFTNEYLFILEQQFQSKKQEADTYKLLENLSIGIKKKIIKEIDGVSHKFIPINLYGDVRLKFLSPNGQDELELSRQHSQYKNKQSTKRPDFNIVSTIIEITDDKKSIVLTADAPKSSFARINGKIKSLVELVQVPHHGSQYNIDESFWKGLTKKTDCESVFSVGDVKKDKLPKSSVVKFFEKEGYHNVSTNFVYGLIDHYEPTIVVVPVPIASVLLKTFATNKKVTPISSKAISALEKSPRFSGDKKFQVPF